MGIDMMIDIVLILVVWDLSKIGIEAFSKWYHKKQLIRKIDKAYPHYIIKEGEYEKLSPNQWREMHGFEPIRKGDENE